jgi:ribosomal protein S19E (S16A)
MKKITARNLTRDEWEWLKRLSDGGVATRRMTAQMADRLKRLGLAEQWHGGTVISQEGRRLVAEVIASRRAGTLA